MQPINKQRGKVKVGEEYLQKKNTTEATIFIC